MPHHAPGHSGPQWGGAPAQRDRSFSRADDRLRRLSWAKSEKRQTTRRDGLSYPIHAERFRNCYNRFPRIPLGVK